jgi:hypothetical protein
VLGGLDRLQRRLTASGPDPLAAFTGFVAERRAEGRTVEVNSLADAHVEIAPGEAETRALTAALAEVRRTLTADHSEPRTEPPGRDDRTDHRNG